MHFQVLKMGTYICNRTSKPTQTPRLREVSVSLYPSLSRINSVQTRCIVKGEAQKSPLFWRFSGGFCFSQDRLFSRNSTRKPLNLIKSPIFTNAPCKTTCLYNAPSMHTVDRIIPFESLYLNTQIMSARFQTCICIDIANRVPRQHTHNLLFDFPAGMLEKQKSYVLVPLSPLIGPPDFPLLPGLRRQSQDHGTRGRQSPVAQHVAH